MNVKIITYNETKIGNTEKTCYVFNMKKFHIESKKSDYGTYICNMDIDDEQLSIDFPDEISHDKFVGELMDVIESNNNFITIYIVKEDSKFVRTSVVSIDNIINEMKEDVLNEC